MSGRGSESWKRHLIFICAIILFIAIFGVVVLFATTRLVAMMYLIGVVVAGLLLWAGWLADSRITNVSGLAQGAAAIATIVALFVAVGIYFLERKDKPSITFDVDVARALLAAPEGRGTAPAGRGTASAAASRNVLLGIRVLVTNNSSRRVEINCIALDLFRPARPDAVVRIPEVSEDLQLVRVAGIIPFDRPDGSGGEHDRNVAQMNECMNADLRRQRARPGNANISRSTVRPLFMWDTLSLEPNDVDDRYFEIQVGCGDPLLRVLVKMRINPEDEDGYETKAIIPLAEICSARESGVAIPMATGGPPVT